MIIKQKYFLKSILTNISKYPLSFLTVTFGAGLTSNGVSLTQLSSWEPALAYAVLLPEAPESPALIQIHCAPFPVLSPP